MITIIAQNQIKTDKLNEFIALVTQLVQETRKNETGCIRYELLQDAQSPNLLTLLEEWESQEALNSHMKSKHFQETSPLLADYLEKPGEVHLYTRLI